MNDGTISGSFTPPSGSTQTAPPIVKVEQLPPNLPPNTTVTGEVVASEDGQVSIKTEQGLVVLKTEIEMEVGQKVSIKVQAVIQQANRVYVAELLNIGKEQALDKPATPQPAQYIDPVKIYETPKNEEFKPVQATLAQLPDTLTDETLEVMVKSLLNLPVGKPLPPALQEGFDKFRQLIGLLSQANFLPAQSLQSNPQNSDAQKNIVTALMQLFNPGTTKAGSNPLLQQPPQNFVQLQTILPGQNLSPNILVDMHHQLTALLTPQEGKPPLFTMPALALVLGMQPTALPGMKPANLVFMATPQAQQLIGLLNPQPDQKPILPGTIFAAAFKPQVQPMLTMPALPQNLGPLIETFMPLHPALGDTWPALDDLWTQALAQQTVQPEAMAALRQIIPTPTPQHLPPAMLLFMAILKNGVPSEWISDRHLAGLEKIEKTALLARLTQDMQGIKSRMEENLSSDAWRPLPIPMQVGDQIMRLQWFYRHPEEHYTPSQNDEEEQPKKKKTRFLLNVPKTTVGDIQIDGLVQEKTLDVILRTENPLPSGAENAILERYTKALEITGLFGSLNFQQGRQHYVHV